MSVFGIDYVSIGSSVKHGNITGTLQGTSMHNLVPTGADRIPDTKLILCAYDKGTSRLLIAPYYSGDGYWYFNATNASGNVAVDIDYYYIEPTPT